MTLKFSTKKIITQTGRQIILICLESSMPYRDAKKEKKLIGCWSVSFIVRKEKNE